MTQSLLVTLGLALVGQVLYQIAQRAVPADASPLIVLAAAYFAAGGLWAPPRPVPPPSWYWRWRDGWRRAMRFPPSS